MVRFLQFMAIIGVLSLSHYCQANEYAFFILQESDKRFVLMNRTAESLRRESESEMVLLKGEKITIYISKKFKIETKGDDINIVLESAEISKIAFDEHNDKQSDARYTEQATVSRMLLRLSNRSVIYFDNEVLSANEFAMRVEKKISHSTAEIEGLEVSENGSISRNDNLPKITTSDPTTRKKQEISSSAKDKALDSRSRY